MFERILASLITLFVTATAATSGVGARCTMDGESPHCRACPDGTTAWAAPVDCPLILPASPETSDAEQQTAPVVLAILVESAGPTPFAHGAAPFALAAARVAEARPPGHAVLRI